MLTFNGNTFENFVGGTTKNSNDDINDEMESLCKVVEPGINDSSNSSLSSINDNNNKGHYQDDDESNNNNNNNINDSLSVYNFNKLLRDICTIEYWTKHVYQRFLYEFAILISCIPHLLLKNIMLSWGAMYLFRNLAYIRHIQGPRLKDLGFELIPELDNDFWSEFVLYTNGISAYSLLFVPLIFDYAHTKHGIFSVNIFMKIVNIQCVGHILRFCTYISTSLPGPAPHCQPGAPLYRDTLSVYEIFTRRSKVHVDPNCGDLIFSGHMFQTTSICVVMLAHIHKLFPPQYYKVLGRMYMFTLISTVIIIPYFILAARNHYSVDVVVSLYVAPMTWWAMEGFYTTTYYKRLVIWWDRFVPQFILNYLHRANPYIYYNNSPKKELESLVEKYNMDPTDSKRLQQLILTNNNDNNVNNNIEFDVVDQSSLNRTPSGSTEGTSPTNITDSNTTSTTTGQQQQHGNNDKNIAPISDASRYSDSSITRRRLPLQIV